MHMNAVEILNRFEQSGAYPYGENDLLLLAPASTVGNVIISLLQKVTKPRGMSNDDTVRFFDAWCAGCHDKKDSAAIDHMGVVQMMGNVPNAVVFSPYGTQEKSCHQCGEDMLIFVLHGLTSREREDLMHQSLISVAKEYNAIRKPGLQTPVTAQKKQAPAASTNQKNQAGESSGARPSILTYVLLALGIICIVYMIIDLIGKR